MTSQICVWDFTAPMEDIEKGKITKFLEFYCKNWTFQAEEGESGYKHWQGRMSLKMKRNLSQMATLGKAEGLEKWHLSPTSNENRDNAFYVMKEETRIGGPWADNDEKPLYVPRQYREVLEQGLHPWQKQIEDDIDVWNTRIINYVYDPSGGIGKSSLVGILCSSGRARMVPPMNDYKDIMRFVMSFPPSKMYLIDFPRALNQERIWGLMSGLEDLKKGYCYDDRYKGQERWFDSPNIWVFANTMPDQKMLTKDRWMIYEIKDNKLVGLKETKKREFEFVDN